jgi:hypothetical protein
MNESNDKNLFKRDVFSNLEEGMKNFDDITYNNIQNNNQ